MQSIAPFEEGLARIHNDRGVVGAGFLVSQDLVCTCAHVIEEVLEGARGEEVPERHVSLDFPLRPDLGPLKASVVFREAPRAAGGDIAILKLNGSVPNVEPLPLLPLRDLRGHSFRAMGFPDGRDGGVWIKGTFSGPQAAGWLQIEGDVPTGYWVEGGFSGTAVWDTDLGAVAGMIVATERKSDARVAYMVGASALARIPVLRGGILAGLQTRCARQVAGQIARLGTKYDKERYVQRREIEDRLRKFIDNPAPAGDAHLRNAILIVDRAGAGKTNLLANLAEVYGRQHPCLLVLGSDTRLQREGTRQYLAAVAPGGLDALASWARVLGVKVVILIDAINEADVPSSLIHDIEDLLSSHSGDAFRFILTCRDLYWRNFQRLETWKRHCCDVLIDRLAVFSPEEVEEAHRKYFSDFRLKVSFDSPEAKDELRHPLLLRFFCEAYGDPAADSEVELNIKDIRLAPLFSLYLDKKIGAIAARIGLGEPREFEELAAARRVKDHVLAIGQSMLRLQRRSLRASELPAFEWGGSDTLAITLRIADEGILRYEDQDFFTFQYQEFEEYIIALGLMTRLEEALRGSQRGILARVLPRRLRAPERMAARMLRSIARKDEGFEDIFGVLLYLGLMFQEKNIVLWSHLVRHGSKWQDLVCDAIRRLRRDEITSSSLVKLRQLLQAGSSGFQARVLDSLSQLKHPGLLPIFLESTGHRSLRTRTAALRALLHLSSQSELMEEARRAIVERLEDTYKGKPRTAEEIYLALEIAAMLRQDRLEQQRMTGRFMGQPNQECLAELPLGHQVVGAPESVNNPEKRIWLDSAVRIGTRFVLMDDFKGFLREWLVIGKVRGRDVQGRRVATATWYEAFLYARSRGASLPGAHEWEIAARVGLLADVNQLWEWCADACRDDPAKRMIRGCLPPGAARSLNFLTHVEGEDPGGEAGDIGFRIVVRQEHE